MARNVQKEARQEDRFALQRTAAAITPHLRVAHCLWTATGQHVDVLRRGEDARFGGPDLRQRVGLPVLFRADL